MTQPHAISSRSRFGWIVAGMVALLGCGLALAQGVAGPRASGRPATPAGALWISDSPLDDGRRLLVVVDAVNRHAALYHVDPHAGTLTLRSTRDMTWDLTLEDFNAQEPTPAALRRALDGSAGEPGPPRGR